MKTLVSILFLLLTILNGIYAQTNESKNATTRKKVQFSLALGWGVSSLNYDDSEDNYDHEDIITTRVTYPNLKLGAMISKKTALNFYVPMGFQNNESFTIYSIAVQHWSKTDKNWVMLGAGRLSNMYFDFSADGVGWGCSLSTGFEIKQNKGNAIDLQFRTMWGLAGYEYNKSLFAFEMLVGIDFSKKKLTNK